METFQIKGFFQVQNYHVLESVEVKRLMVHSVQVVSEILKKLVREGLSKLKFEVSRGLKSQNKLWIENMFPSLKLVAKNQGWEKMGVRAGSKRRK